MTQTTRVAIQTRSQPLQATVTVPGSKSLSNRALLCAALADGESIVSNIAPGDDTVAMLAGLRALGARIMRNGSDATFVGPIDTSSMHDVTVHANLAGTTARFLTALAALRSGKTVITGESALLRRPMDGLLGALGELGAQVVALETPGHLPVRVSSGSGGANEVTIAGDVSSQFITALMLIAPYLTRGLRLRLQGEIVSEPYIAMTMDVMKNFGGEVDRTSSGIIEVHRGRYTGRHFEVEADASSAAYPLAAAAIVGGSVTVRGIDATSLQGDAQFAAILGRMGCSVRANGAGLAVWRDPSSRLQGVAINMSSMSDLVPTLAAVAMFATSPTTISGVGFIRSKESDRLGDLAVEMRKLGGDIDVTADGLVIRPSVLHGGEVETHHDHRIAMAMSLVGLAVSGVSINDAGVVSKSWPDFWQMLIGL